MAGHTIPTDPSTLVSVLQNLALREDKRITFIEGHAQERTFTYRQLLDQALRVLHHLNGNGVRKDDELVIQLDDNLSFVVVFWACLLGGIRPVPLSAGGQDAHRQKVFSVWRVLGNPFFIGPPAVLASLGKYAREQGLSADFEAMQQRFICPEEARAGREAGVVARVAPDDIALIQFTSGSTGDPKGVTLTHRNLLANTSDIAARSAIGPADSMLSWMPLTHDMGLICFHLTGLLAHIDQLLMPTPLFIRRPVLWLEKASQHRATLLYSPNFGYRYVLSALDGSVPADWDLSAVRLIYNGAEPISKALCDQFLATLAPRKLAASVIYPGYGLAEASVAVALPMPGEGVKQHIVHRQRVNLGDQVTFLPGSGHPDGVAFVEVGFPIDQCSVRICGPSDEPLPDGTIGHIQIRGRNVTEGYYRNPGATVKMRTPDGWTRTGDLGFMLGERLTITGRHKNIIILNGQNFYPQDIEEMVQEVEGAELGKVVACGSKAANAEEELLIFVLFKNDLPAFVPCALAIRECVAARTGLVVSKIIPVRKIPKTTSGKIQHFQLLEQYRNGNFAAVMEALDALVGAARPEMAKEGWTTALRAVVADVLGRENLGQHEDFFDSGLNSLQAARLITRLHARLGVSLTFREVYDHRSLATLAPYAAGKRGFAAGAIGIAPAAAFCPLTPTQHRFWLLSQFDRHQAPCNLFSAHAVEGELDVDALEKAFAEVIRRHDSLRATFVLVDGEPMQRVSPPAAAPFRLTYTDLSAVADPEAEARRLAAAEAAGPFDLAHGPLLRSTILKTAAGRYIFTFTIHHIIADGWSVGVLIDELKTLYPAYRSGQPVTLPQLPLQYKDYVAWRHTMAFPGTEAARAYWQGELAGEIPALQLPGPPAGPANGSLRGSRFTFAFDLEQTRALHQLSSTHRVTLFVTLTALLRVVLYKFTRQPDLVLGTIATGRDHQDLEKQIGCFINTLALRLPVTGQETFGALLQQVQEKLFSALQHQHHSPERLLEERRGANGAAQPALFNALILFQDLPYRFDFNELFGPGVSTYPVDPPTSLVDLQFEFLQSGPHLSLTVTYNPDRVDAALVPALVKHFHAAAGAAARDGVPVALLDVLPAADKQYLLHAWNQTRSTEPSAPTVMALFEQQARQTPDHVAVVCGPDSLTYRQLNQAANQLAHYLTQTYRVNPEGRIGLLLPRSAQWVVAALAVLKAGAAYLPLDSDYPAARVQALIEGCRPQLVLATADLRPRAGLAACGCPVLVPEDLQQHLDAMPVDNPRVAVGPNSLAYVMYTSGSTGTPKGVMIEHGSLADYVQTFTAYFGISEADAVVHQSSVAFDTAVEEIFPVLCRGGKLVIAPRGAQYLEELLQTLATHSVTVLSATPAVIAEINRQPDQITTLRLLISGGDVLKPTDVDRLLEKVAVYNTYGPTESTVCALYHRVEYAAEASLLGRPIRNRTVYLLDEHLQLVPPGAAGEICIGGAGVARGYLDRPEETAARFIENPYVDGERLYRTGDLGRLTPEANLAFLGRMDDQVKIRGYRIELGEVERAIMRSGMVQDAVVTTSPAGGAEKRLVAYVVWPGADGTSQLRDYLAEHLPVYMLPHYWMALPAIPRNANGKTDRPALPRPVQPGAAPSLAAPRNAAEAQLAALWAGVFNRPVGITDDFFALGGNSITAARVVARISSEMGVNLDLRTIFTHPTVAGLAPVVSSATPRATGAIAPLPDGQAHYEASYAQKRLWVLHQFDPAGGAYNLAWTYTFAGEQAYQAIRFAVGELIARHQSLRTTFVAVEGQLKQVIHPYVAAGAWVSEERLDGSAGPEAVAGCIRQEAETPFDLEKGPLLRLKFIRTATGSTTMVLTIHHIACDGWSAEVLLKEFVQLAGDFVAGVRTSLSPLRVQYRDFTAWQYQRMAGEDMAKHRAYWLNRFSGGVPVLELPLCQARPVTQTVNGATVRRKFSPQLTAGLHAVSREQGVSLFMTLVSLVKLVFHRYSGQSDIVVGTPVAGRHHVDLENQVGYYLNALALYTVVDPADTFRALLGKVKTIVLEAFDHQAYPIDKLVEELNLPRDTSRAPLFDVLVVLQNFDNKALRVTRPGDVITAGHIREVDTPTCVNDLLIEFNEYDGLLGLKLRYNTDLFRTEQMEYLAGHLQELARQIIADPDQGILSYGLLTEPEKEQLLHGFNGGEMVAGGPAEPTVQALFEAQAARTPLATAVTYNDSSFSYQTLNAHANRLAHYLRQNHALRPGEAVALIVDRSEWMVVWVLGILKAGAAYVPIDPAMPRTQAEWMMKDCATALLLTDQADWTGTAGLAVVALDPAGPVLAAYPAHNPPASGNTHDLAYIIYTSGTTGRPKGVMVTHANVLSVVPSWREAYRLDTFPVRLLQMANLSFDVFCGDLCRSLLTGGQMVICPADAKVDVRQLHGLLQGHQVTIFESTPALIIPLFNFISEQGLDVSFLKVLILGSDVCLTDDYRRLVKRFGAHTRIINSYGTTETTIDTSWYEESPEHLPATGITPIGKPLSNSRFYVLDANLSPVPVGIVGELYIGGAGVTEGYLNQPDLTAARFMADPFVSTGRMYRTGDIARWLFDGNVEFLGRRDNQVKIRGYRIELGEIENSLLGFEGVQNAAVTVQKDQAGELRLVGYVSGVHPEAKAGIRHYLSQHLPAYMVPAGLVVLEQLPLNRNGKVDRKALPVPEASQWREGAYIAPQGRIEIALAGMWSELLGVGVGSQDNFFALGGHSLKAMQMISRISQQLSLPVGLRDVFAHPTLGGLAGLLSGRRQQQQAPLPALAQQPDYALSHAQQRLWILQQMDPEQRAYSMLSAFELTGALDRAAFGRALGWLVERHESLRTCFVERQGEPRQVVVPASESAFRLHYQDLSQHYQDLSQRYEEGVGHHEGVGDHERVGELAQVLADEELRTGFELSRGPLLRVRLVRLQEQGHLVVVAMHHIISDGWSMGKLLEEVLLLYKAACRGEHNPLPPLAIHYKDFAHWQNQLLSGPGLQGQRDYWLAQLGQAPLLSLPLDKARPPVKTYQGASCRLELESGLSEQLRALAHQHQVSLFMVVTAAYKAILHYYTGAEDLVIGTPVSGRTRSELEQQVGFFVNMLALRTRLTPQDSYQELLEKVKQTLVEAYEHQDYPFDKLVAELGLDREQSRSPLFDTGLTWHAGLQQSADVTGTNLLVREHELATRLINADLWLHAGETDGRYWFSLHYNTDLFEESKVELIKDRLAALLRACTRTPGESLAALFEEVEKEMAPPVTELGFAMDMNF